MPPSAITARLAIPAALLLLAGCAESRQAAEPPDRPVAITPADRPVAEGVREVRVERATPRDVVLAVPTEALPQSAGECADPLRMGAELTLQLRWPDDEGRALRLVSATFDADGNVQSYLDARGALTNVYRVGTAEPGTSITLAFGMDVALVQNQGADAPSNYILPLEEALRSRALDVPEWWVQELHDRCGPGLPGAGR